MTSPPDSTISIWRSISNAIALSSERNEFMFLISTLVPNALLPLGSDRHVGVEPDRSLLELASDTPSSATIDRSSCAHPGFEGAAESVWTRPRPAARRRLKSRSVPLGVDSASGSEMVDFPVSSSMWALDADTPGLAVDLDVEMPVVTHRDIELGDLVVLGKVGVEIVLPVEHRSLRDLAIQGQPDRHDRLDRDPVGHREGAGEPETCGADPRVGLAAGCAAAEHLRGRHQLDVDLDPDDRLPAHAAPSRARGDLEAGETLHLGRPGTWSPPRERAPSPGTMGRPPRRGRQARIWRGGPPCSPDVADVRQVHGERIRGPGTGIGENGRARRRDQHVDLLVGPGEVLLDGSGPDPLCLAVEGVVVTRRTASRCRGGRGGSPRARTPLRAINSSVVAPST